MSIISTMEISINEFLEMYDDLEIVALCKEQDKMDKLDDWIFEEYVCDGYIHDYELYEVIQNKTEKLKQLFEIKE